PTGTCAGPLYHPVRGRRLPALRPWYSRNHNRGIAPSIWGKHIRIPDKHTWSSPSPKQLPPISRSLLSPLYSKIPVPHNRSIASASYPGHPGRRYREEKTVEDIRGGGGGVPSCTGLCDAKTAGCRPCGV